MKNSPRQVTLSENEWKMIHNAMCYRTFNAFTDFGRKDYEKLTKKLEKLLEY